MPCGNAIVGRKTNLNFFWISFRERWFVDDHSPWTLHESDVYPKAKSPICDSYEDRNAGRAVSVSVRHAGEAGMGFKYRWTHGTD